MNEIIKKRLKESIEKEVKIFLHNGFRYFGKITNCDDSYVEILDYKTDNYQIVLISDINNVQISSGGKL